MHQVRDLCKKYCDAWRGRAYLFSVNPGSGLSRPRTKTLSNLLLLFLTFHYHLNYSQLVKNAINALKLPPLGFPPDITLHFGCFLGGSCASVTDAIGRIFFLF